MKLIPKSRAYRKAALETKVAQADFLLSVDKAKARLSPGRLKQDAIRTLKHTAENVQKDAVAGARAHPVITGGVAAAVAALLFRRPLMALSRKAGVSVRKAWDARKNQETSDE